jgi:PPP family 3-phenylpropionic acid transporter
MSRQYRPPTGRLSSFYFFYFSTLGILVPYWGLYLKSLDFSPAQIGELLAILVGTKIVAPYIWGWIADHTGKRIRIVQIGSFLAALSFMLVFGVKNYWGMAAVMMLFSFFWNAILPQYEAGTMNHLGENHHRYSFIRSWGSIGFIMMVMLAGPMIDERGVQVILPILTVAFVMIWIATMFTPSDQGQGHSSAPEASRMISIISKPEVAGLLAIFFLMQFSHGSYYAFFSIYLEQHDYSKTQIGQYWALSVLAEVMVFLLVPWLIKLMGVKPLLVFSLSAAVVRWILTAWYVDNALVMFFSQALHAATFGLFHAVAIFFVHHYFKAKLQGRGQALYSSISFGAGGALGSLLSGYSWETLGPTATYLFSSGSVFVAVIICMIFVKNIR